MTGGGRSFRFLGVVVGGWTVVRVILLWPSIDSPSALVAAVTPAPARAAVRPDAIRSVPHPRPARHAAASGVSISRRVASAASHPVSVVTIDIPPDAAGTTRPAEPDATVARSAASPVPAPPATHGPGARLAGSSWLILRAGGGDGGGTGFGATLGASQAGVRLTYALDDARRVAIAARLSGALGTRQREAAIGIDWRPGALPVHLVAERRVALDGGRGATAAGIIAGIDPTAIGGGFRLEAYGQAGAILRGGTQGFADGAVRVARPVAAVGGLRIDLGAGTWGGAQRGAARIDVGPSLGLAIPVAGRTLRANLEWRERIAGQARPGSGPALSIGTDF